MKFAELWLWSRFTEKFSRTEDGLPRRWAPREDISLAMQNAYKDVSHLLAQIAVLRLGRSKVELSVIPWPFLITHTHASGLFLSKVWSRFKLAWLWLFMHVFWISKSCWRVFPREVRFFCQPIQIFLVSSMYSKMGCDKIREGWNIRQRDYTRACTSKTPKHFLISM